MSTVWRRYPREALACGNDTLLRERHRIAIIVKDLAELLHAVAWPAVALIAVFVFRGAVREILGRIPFDRASSLKVPGLAEVKLGPKPRELETARKTTIPRGVEPDGKESDKSA